MSRQKSDSSVASATKNNPAPLVSASASSIPTSAPVVMTVAQVAAYLQVPVSSIYEKTRHRGLNRRPLPARRVGRYLRFIFSEVEQYLLDLPHEVPQAKRQYRKRSTQSAEARNE